LVAVGLVEGRAKWAPVLDDNTEEKEVVEKKGGEFAV